MAKSLNSSFKNIDTIETTNLLTKYTDGVSSLLIGEIEVRSGDQVRMSLGMYQKQKRLIGFSIEPTPNPQDEDTIVTHITRLDEGDEEYELVLHIANYGDKTIEATIRELL